MKSIRANTFETNSSSTHSLTLVSASNYKKWETGEAIPSVRSLAKSLHISILTVQKAYATLQEDGFIESTAGKGCYVSAQNQDFYLEEQQKKIEEHFTDAIEVARASGISLDKLINLLTLLYQEDE